MYCLRQLLFSLFFFAIPFINSAQKPDLKPIEITGDNIGKPHAIFVGEVHDIYEGWAFKQQIIRWANKRYDIKDVVMEMGSADAYLFNQYIQHGDTTVFAYYGHDTTVMQRLEVLENLHRETNCTFWGIDFERGGYAIVCRAILKKHAPAANTALYSYLDKLVGTIDGKDDAAHRKEHIKDYEQARKLFVSEQKQLKEWLAEDYTIIERILLNHATERHMKGRDEAMAQNLKEQLGTKPFICITGAGHLHFKRNTLLKRYLAEKKAEDVLLVNMLCKNCYNTSYYGTELSSLAGDFDEKHEQYFKKVCDDYCKPGAFMLVNQHTLHDFPGSYYPIPTYYAVFKDQPRW